MRQYEIHLPLSYDNGEPIEREKIRHVSEELVAAFGSFSVPYRRTWKYDGVKYVEIMRIEILADGDRLTKKRLTDFKEHLQESLQQIDILITSHDVQTV